MQLIIPIPQDYSDSVVLKVIEVITKLAKERNLPLTMSTTTEEGEDSFFVLIPNEISPSLIAYLGVAIGIALEVFSNKEHLILTP